MIALAKRSWLVSLLLLSACVRLGGGESVAIVDQATSMPIAAFLGDSYTAGSGSSESSKRWTTLVSAHQGWKERNFGVPRTGYATNNRYLDRLGEIVDAKPEFVVISGGINDWSTLNGDPASLFHSVADTFTQVRENLPAAAIIGVGPSFTGDSTPARLAFDKAVADATSSVHGVFVSLLEPTPAIVPDMVLPDRTHVNDAGHAAIADRVISILPAPAS